MPPGIRMRRGRRGFFAIVVLLISCQLALAVRARAALTLPHRYPALFPPFLCTGCGASRLFATERGCITRC